MMKTPVIKRACLGMAVVFFAAAFAWALDEGRTADQAMRALQKSDKDAAGQALEKALAEKPDSALLNYYAGLVSYHSGDYDKAREHFAKALTLPGREEEAAANYNIGNSLFQGAKGLRAADPGEAIERLKEALNYYGRAIELNNADKDASYNYELTKKVIKVIKEKMPPPMPKPQGGGQSKEDTEKEQQQQQQQQQQQDQEEKKQEDQEKQQQQQGQEQQKEQPSGGTPQPEETEKEPKKQQAQAPDKKDLTEEEARTLVSTYGQEGPRMDINKDKRVGAPRVIKNW